MDDSKMLKIPLRTGGGSTDSVDKQIFDSRLPVLTWAEYILIIFIIQYGNLEYLSSFLTCNMRYGGVMFTTLYIVIFLFVGMPLIGLHLFLGHFSKCGMFRLWSLSPIFKGVSISATILTLLSGILNSVYTSTSLLYIINMLRDQEPWMNCKFSSATNSCISYNNIPESFNSTDICKPYYVSYHNKISKQYTINHTTIKLASLEYYRYQIAKLHNEQKELNTIGSIKFDLCLCLIFVWVTTAVASTWGLNSIKSYLRRIGEYSILFIIVSFATSIIRGLPKSETKFNDYDQELAIFDKTMIIHIFFDICAKALPTIFICIGAYAPENTMPTVDALLTSVLYIIILFITSVWLTINVGVIRTKIHLQSIHCITYLGIEVIMGLIPDFILNYLILSTLFIFGYFIQLFLMGISALIICIVTILDSIEDINLQYRRYRLHISIFLCVICFFVSLVFLTPSQVLITESWFMFGCQLIIILIIVLYLIATMWIYGVNRIHNDIDFKYKTKFSIAFWLTCWKTYPFIALTILVLRITHIGDIYHSIPSMINMRLTCILLTVFIIIPIPVAAFYHYFSHIRSIATQNIASIFKCSEAWGPPDGDLRRARNRFNPKKEIRYKSQKQQCRHNCLLHSSQLKREVERLDANRKMFLEELSKLNTDAGPK